MFRSKNRNDDMSSVASSAERIVRETMLEYGVKKPDARAIVARETGLKSGTFDRLARGQLRHVERVQEKLNAFLLRSLERRIIALQHELEIRRLAAEGQSDPDLAAAAIALEQAKRALNRQAQ